MARILISALPWFLLFCGCIAFIGLVSKGGRQSRLPYILLMIFAVAMWLLSVPATAGWLADTLTVQERATRGGRAARTIVVVLAGGSFRSTDGQEYLSLATTDRVITGARVFRLANAERIVMSGRSNTGNPAAQVALMKQLAVMLDVPPDRIGEEPRARNTFEHPRELLRSGLASPADRMLVVTEPIHIRRAIAEFRKIFPLSEPVSTPRRPTPRLTRLQAWLPHVESLTETTRSIQEWVGILWYSLRDFRPLPRANSTAGLDRARSWRSKYTPADLERIVRTG